MNLSIVMEVVNGSNTFSKYPKTRGRPPLFPDSPVFMFLTSEDNVVLTLLGPSHLACLVNLLTLPESQVPAFAPFDAEDSRLSLLDLDSHVFGNQ